MGSQKITIHRVETDFYPTAETPSPLTQPRPNRNTDDSFLECHSQSALGCLAEGFVSGFLAGFTSPFWLASACNESVEYGDFIPLTGDAMPDGIRGLAPNRGNTQRTDTAAADVEDVEDATVPESIVVPQDVLRSIDIETPKELEETTPSATDATIETGTDGTDAIVIVEDTDHKETLPPPIPLSCKPENPVITCIEGEGQVTANLIVQGATSLVCGDKEKQITTTESASISVPTKGCTTSTVVCQVKNANTGKSVPCPPLKIAAIKPNSIPTGVPQGPNGVVLPSGNHCYQPGNLIPFSVIVSDGDKDTLTVWLNVYRGNDYVVGSEETPDFVNYSKGPVIFNLSATSLSKGAGVYCYDFDLDDKKGGKTTTAKKCFTASEKGLLALWPFDDMQGKEVTDVINAGIVSGGINGKGVASKGVSGVIDSSNPSKMWQLDPVTGAKMLCFSGNGDSVSVNVPEPWKNLSNLTFKARFSVDAQNGPDNFLVHWSPGVQHGLILRFQGIQKTLFGLCDTYKTACINTEWWWAISNTPLVPNQIYEMAGVITMGSAKLYTGMQIMAQKSANNKNVKQTAYESNPTAALLGGTITFGKLPGAAGTDYSFKGCVDQIALYNVDAMNCQ